jgi:hypothetical protein
MPLVTPFFCGNGPQFYGRLPIIYIVKIALLLWKKLAHLRTAKYVLYTA